MKAGTSTETLSMVSGNVGIGGTAHATASLDITNTSQHIRLNNSSELGIITLDSDGNMDFWAHGADEVITFRNGTSTGTVLTTIGSHGIGVGVTPEGAYDGYTSIEFGQQGAIFANDASDDLGLKVNTYLDSGGNWKRKETGVASSLDIDGDQLKFFTAASGSADANITFAQKLRIDSDGIKFGTDTAAANALDDYEEGTYTPTMFGVTTAGSVAYSSQAGWYTKVGRIVVAYFDINVSSASGMAGTTALTLPVQAGNFNAYMGVTYWDVDDDYFDGGKGASGYVYPNTTRIELYQTSDGAKGHNT